MGISPGRLIQWYLCTGLSASEKWCQRHSKSNVFCELRHIEEGKYLHRPKWFVNRRHCLKLAPWHAEGNEMKFTVWLWSLSVREEGEAIKKKSKSYFCLNKLSQTANAISWAQMEMYLAESSGKLLLEVCRAKFNSELSGGSAQSQGCFQSQPWGHLHTPCLDMMGVSAEPKLCRWHISIRSDPFKKKKQLDESSQSKAFPGKPVIPSAQV